MSKNILVTYATYTGSAETIAEIVALDLESKGFTTTLMRMSDVKDIKNYEAVVAGSSIHSGKWLPEAFDFLEMYREQLKAKPFAAFLVCMTLAMKNGSKYLQFVSDFMLPVRKIVMPVSEGLFSGKLEIKKIQSLNDRIKFRISVAAGIWKEGDYLNKEEIHKWSESLSHLL